MTFLVTLFKAIAAAAGFLSGLIAFLKERDQIRAGEDKATARSLKELDDRVRKARDARRAVDPGRLPDDDPYRRD
ncbi:MAG: hypothetical protein HC850_00200 [Rhodomicrobium sp.]|nr:hypothetical protein [Rhodomicrobium sp.]